MGAGKRRGRRRLVLWLRNAEVISHLVEGRDGKRRREEIDRLMLVLEFFIYYRKME